MPETQKIQTQVVFEECTYNNDKLELKLLKAEVTAFSGNWINPGNTGIIYLCDKDKKGKRDVCKGMSI